MPIGIGIASGVSTLAQAGIQAGAASKAGKLAEQTGQQNSDFDRGIYNTATSNLQPTITQGTQAGSALGGLLGLNGNTAADSAFKHYLDSTNYKFQRDQGLQGVEYANAPAFNSGATGKALINYAEGQAGSALAGYQALLSGQQTLGAESAAALGGIGVNAANLSQQATEFGATGKAAGIVGQANAVSNAFQGLDKAFGSYVGQSSFGAPNALSGTSFGAPNAQGVSVNPAASGAFTGLVP